jgi:hypothetical protein
MGFLKQVSGGAIDLEGVFSPEVSQIATLGALYLTGGALAGAIGASATSGLSIALADTAISGATIVTAGYAIGTVASVFVMAEAMKAITGQGAAGGAANVNQNLATGILLNTASNVAGIPVIYGTRRVGGTRVFTEVSGASNEYLHLLIVLGEGEVSAAPQVYIDNVPITDAKFAGLVSSTLYTGTDTQAAYGTLIAALPTKWTAAHQGKGVAYLALQLKYATTAFGGFPTITADVQGKKVYDPRSGLTAYSNNPALCIRDYLTNTRYGRGIAAALIDDGTIISAANYCDALVTVPGGSQARYTCDGVVDINQTAYDNIKALLTSCRGLLVYSGGLYKLMLDQPTAATFTFTEDNITGNWTITQPGRRSKYNRVTAGFFNPAASWNPDLAISDSSAYRLIDNSLLLEAKIDLPFCADLYRAQQLAGLHLKQSRFGVTCMFTAFQSGLRCEVGDVVSITHSTPGWSGKLFRVMQITIKDTDEVEVVVNEYDATVYNLDTLTAVTSTTTLTLPNVFSVPTPTGLALSSGTSELLLNGDGTVTSRLKVAWTAPTNIFADKMEIQYQRSGISTWQTFTTTSSADGAAWVWPVQDGALYNVRVRFVNTAGVQSPWVLGSHTIIGKTAVPSDVSSVGFALETLGVRLSWTAITDADRAGYEIRYGGTGWVDATFLAFTTDSSYLWRMQTAGTQTVRIKAKDTTGNYSTTATSAAVVVTGPSAPSVTYGISGPDELLSWTIPASSFLVDRYEIRYGSSFALGTFVDTSKATGYRRKADYSGGRTYWIAAIDAATNYGVPAAIDVNISIPGVPAGLRADVVDNNALLYWGAPATGTLPVDRYEARKGASWAAGTIIGSNGNSTFTTVFEQQSGTYSYWIAAVDSAGNVGVAASVSAYINQPPDYVLRANIDSTFTGANINALANGATLLLPVNTSETWSQHFSNNGYATPQAQITAGNPLYISPSTTTASYTESIDYGSNLPATNITVTLNSTILSGTVGASCRISYRLLATDAWTDGIVGATSMLAFNFRYIKVVYSFSASAGANLLRVNGINVKLSIKQRSDSGTGTAAAGGTAVTFGYPFLSADTPIVQPNGSTPLIPVVIYVGGVNPTGFTVKLYNLAGTDVGGAFSWSVKGY